ncbi:hypothetical protein [Christiangramia sabulilitoris]|uniref:Uncharacterized protein n=1 Tax=Christiangramia sabulilitoris TaxID=2583991 RepID=A0A550I2P1_9FLAO|nr:hypothetical protein [Christiangramia sabulilitoris]TRO65254.1 hypothetical protein FGM01_07545 [Christiangramia sabulilitoris]
MKKILASIIFLLIILVSLTYWSVSSTDKNFKTCEIKNFEDMEAIDFSEHDSVLVAPSTLYEGNLVKEFMQGKNYRDAWATPVMVPIAFLDTLKGGLEVIKKGGGKQTHSLKLSSKDGTVYTLRSVTKDPKKLIPEIAEDLALENIIVDGISAQHPFGAILAARLADKAGVLHTRPVMYFIPKQEKLKGYNKKYGNRLYLLEYETESDRNWTSLSNVNKIIETKQLQELKQEQGNNLSIDKAALIKTRLFDLLIGDWDRHAEQWGWALQKSGENIVAIPIPGDRDNAFFNLEGLIPSIITNQNIEPLVRPFKKDIDYMPGLVYPFDRYFLLHTPKELFVEQARELQKSLTNAAIEDAFEAWPEQISRLDKQEISEKIKNRRDHLVDYAEAFYNIIQEQGILTEPLKGSEDIHLQDLALLNCFECK